MVPVMSTEMLQGALAASAPPDKDTEDAPATAVTVPVHELARLFGVATTRPAGSASVKAMPVSKLAEFGLLTVKPREVEPFSGIEVAPKDLVMEGGSATPVPLRDKVCGLLLALSVTLRVATLEPMEAGVNVTVMVQVPPLAATVAPQVLVSE